jgi:hypothetical protein
MDGISNSISNYLQALTLDQMSSQRKILTPSSPRKKSTTAVVDSETKRHLNLCPVDNSANPSNGTGDDFPLDLEAAPLFSSSVTDAISSSQSLQKPSFPAFGLLGIRTAAHNSVDGTSTDLPREDNLVYANLQYPWSTFLCGQQGAGKSHTMSCLLENALLSDGQMGPNPNAMAGVAFHYDKFTSSTATQVCEAAYLCSRGIKVQVLVSPSNLAAMEERYHNLPGLPEARSIEVIPLLFGEKQLNVANMKNLMGVDNDDKNPPLYMSVVNKVLKELSVRPGAASAVNYREMKALVRQQGLTTAQTSFLEMRYSLIEWFLNETAPATVRERAGKIQFKPGTILIVDLSCPFVTEADACSLFSIFLQIFLAQRGQRPLIIALDEAHKVNIPSLPPSSKC